MTNPDSQSHAIKSPTIRWTEDGLPESVEFNDRYFSKDDGLAETDYVFLQQNQLKQRFSALGNDHCFVIAETGFGTGLNFLAAWALWMQTAPVSARLHFVSVEKHPLTQEQLSRALSLWPSLQPYYSELLAQYRCMQTSGFHRLSFAGGRIQLTLIINDAQTGLEHLFASSHPYFLQPQWQGVDAWFLDGFEPAKNPAMWAADLLVTIAKLTKPQGTLSTFTAVSSVQQQLQAIGFTVEKVQGFGRRRQMIKARFNKCINKIANTALTTHEHAAKLSINPTTINPTTINPAIPWPVVTHYQATKKTQRIVVLGAGLAGCHTARALADCGYKVTLIDRANTLAAGASGNAQGVVYAKLSPQRQPLGEFNLYSLLYAQRYYRQFWSQENRYGQQCGVLQLAQNAAIAKQHRQLVAIFNPENAAAGLLQYVSIREANGLAGLPVGSDGLYFPNSGWLQAHSVCQTLVDHSSITVVLRTTVNAIDRQSNGWRLNGEHEEVNNTGDDNETAQPWEMSGIHALVIANAADARALPSLQWLPTRAIRGQVTLMPACTLSRNLKTVVCGRGYMVPAMNGHHCIGASFNLHDADITVKQRDHLSNLQHIADLLPRLDAEDVDCGSLSGRVSFRCATPDYLPMTGPVPNINAFDRDYAQLRRDARSVGHRSGVYLPGLYLNIGHGSRGLCYTPLCAALIASIISGEPPPLPQSIIQALNPARFIIRDLIRNRR